MSSTPLDSATAESALSLPGGSIAETHAAAGREYAAGDQALIDSIAAGDELALGELYDRFGAISYGLALRVSRDAGVAERAVQDGFLSVWRSAEEFDAGRGSARTWLLTLVHRRAVDLVKRAQLQ